MRRAILFVLTLGGCTNSGLPGDTSDMAGLPNQDGSVPADLAGASCSAIAASVQTWLDGHLSCTVDADCTVVSTACGLDGQCGTIANTQAPGPYLMSLVSAFVGEGCSALCECPAYAMQPGCNKGVCGQKQLGGGAVGDPCVDGFDCTSGFCLSQAQGFPGGYCAVAQCAVPGPDICPSGSTCVNPSGNGQDYCMKDCNPQQPGQCRDGYVCCGGPGPTGMIGWCVPPNSSLCLEF